MKDTRRNTEQPRALNEWVNGADSVRPRWTVSTQNGGNDFPFITLTGTMEGCKMTKKEIITKGEKDALLIIISDYKEKLAEKDKDIEKQAKGIVSEQEANREMAKGIAGLYKK